LLVEDITKLGKSVAWWRMGRWSHGEVESLPLLLLLLLLFFIPPPPTLRF
jgi:hypothetical protein